MKTRWRLIGVLLLVVGIIIIPLFVKRVPCEQTVTKRHDVYKNYRRILSANQWSPCNTTLTPSEDSYKVNGTLKLIEPDSNYIDFLVVNRTGLEFLGFVSETEPWAYLPLEMEIPNYFLKKEIRNQCDFNLHGLDYDGDYYFLFGVSDSHDQEIELTITEYWQAVENFWKFDVNGIGLIIF